MNKKMTEEDIESTIESEEYSKVGYKTTLCMMTLKNGFEVVGSSACVNASDYDHEIGSEFARKRAMDKVWELEGYLLQTGLQQWGLPGRSC